MLSAENHPSIIVGAGGHAHVIASIVEAKGIPCLGCFDDSYRGRREAICGGISLVGKFKDIVRAANVSRTAYLAIGDNWGRRRLYEAMTGKTGGRWNFPVLLHPACVVEKESSFDAGTVVCVGAIVCTQVSVGKGCIINSGASVDHGSRLGDFVHLAPRVSVAGRVSIGDNTFIGINATVIDKLKIGKNVIIGAGAIVLKDVPDNTTVYGVYH